ncbi:hypothetical protein KIMC2_19450 [Xylocopilactobacillus apis]|uniref:Dipeptidase E n=1 Tax=Xylocopilactobacillus apis TaxID=2932183 RepID=A0AAU9DQJ6_9LACO|nr:hypothetical protein KIMC2_19450 [Xylocopilactobacillus apis]
MDSVKKAPELTNFDALNLIDIYPLPHYESSPFKKVTKNIVNEYSSKINLRAITNQQVILVEENQFTIQSAK